MKKRNTIVISLIMAFLITFIIPLCTVAMSVDSLWNRFVSPPDSARTKVWWFHGETATTREGITADLEAFKQKGVGGVVYYDQVHGKGDAASEVFSTEWWSDLKFAASEARRLGLGFELNIGNGYVAGGPWISHHDAMRRIVCEDTLVVSTNKRDIVLPPVSMPHYESIATLAFPDEEIADIRMLKPAISVNKSEIDAPSLFDNTAKLQQITSDGTVITVDFGRVFTAGHFLIVARGAARPPHVPSRHPAFPARHLPVPVIPNSLR